MQHHLVNGAAILFAWGHLAVLHLDAGLQLQQIAAESAEGRAPPALVQIVQPVNNKAGLHPGSQVRAGPLNFLRRMSGRRQLRAVEHQEPLARGQVPGIHHIYVADVRRRHAGVLIRAGKVAADAEVHDAVPLLVPGPELPDIVEHVDGAGPGQLAAGVHIVINGLRRDLHAVMPHLIAAVHRQGRDGNVVPFDQLRRQVAGAVRNDLYLHILFFSLYKPRARPGGGFCKMTKTSPMRRFTKRRLWYYTGYPLSAQEKLAISPKKSAAIPIELPRFSDFIPQTDWPGRAAPPCRCSGAGQHFPPPGRRQWPFSG